jgi:SAM-dependent methyltransferase
MAWGVWRVPEAKLRLLGDPRGRDILELGCGAARWSIALARRGARSVGIDLSSAQLRHAKRLRRSPRGRPIPLVRGIAECLPFAAGSFDVAFSDWGAMTFGDPYRTVAEAARVLRDGGRLVFATSSPFRAVCQERRGYRTRRALTYDYFGLHRIGYPREINFVLGYGEWIRLFGEHGFVVESLTEIRPPPGARTSYLNAGEASWSHHWPLETIWQVRKTGAGRARAGRFSARGGARVRRPARRTRRGTTSSRAGTSAGPARRPRAR